MQVQKDNIENIKHLEAKRFPKISDIHSKQSTKEKFANKLDSADFSDGSLGIGSYDYGE